MRDKIVDASKAEKTNFIHYLFIIGFIKSWLNSEEDCTGHAAIELVSIH